MTELTKKGADAILNEIAALNKRLDERKSIINAISRVDDKDVAELDRQIAELKNK